METFVVRVWTPLTADDELRGVMRHVGSGTERTFTSTADMAAILRAHARRATPAPATLDDRPGLRRA